MPKDNRSPAQILGAAGGRKSGGMKTPAQIAARRENVKKATAARKAKYDKEKRNELQSDRVE